MHARYSMFCTHTVVLSKRLQWYLAPTLTLCSLLLGVVYYLGLRLTMWSRGQQLAVNKVAIIVVNERYEPVVTHK
jgi:hypothetical protein